MAIYIKGVEMPKDAERVIVIVDTKDGRGAFTFPKPEYDIVYIREPHGRLIDADKAVKDYHEYGISHMYDAVDLADIMADSPTVIEGSK